MKKKTRVISKDDAENRISLNMRSLIPAAPDRVFSAWTDPDELKIWWGPADVRCVSAEVDLRVDGKYRIANELPDGTILWIVGKFEVVERPRLLIYSWRVESGSPTAERVIVRFEEHKNGTEIILKHELISTTALRDQHRQGWVGCMAGLNDYLTHQEANGRQ